MLNFRVRSIDVIAFLRNGIICGDATFMDADPSQQSLASITSLGHNSVTLADVDCVVQPLVVAIVVFTIDTESTLNGVNSINLNHLFNIWHILFSFGTQANQIKLQNHTHTHAHTESSVFSFLVCFGDLSCKMISADVDAKISLAVKCWVGELSRNYYISFFRSSQSRVKPLLLTECTILNVWWVLQK